MNALDVIRARIHDWRHERYIARVSRRIRVLVAAGDYNGARDLNASLSRAVAERSDQQVARMERARGLR